MNTQPTPDSRLPWRLVQTDEGFWQVWTRQDDTPGSRNNYVIADGIQNLEEAMTLAQAPTLLAQRDELRAVLAHVLAIYGEHWTENTKSHARAALAKAEAK